jgi:selenocysteine lyase/cysteine desulfurase
MVSFGVRGASAADVATRLEREGVLVRSIPRVDGAEWVRASIGFWNDDGDVDRLVSAVRALAA